jgi:hypothetical protein
MRVAQRTYKQTSLTQFAADRERDEWGAAVVSNKQIMNSFVSTHLLEERACFYAFAEFNFEANAENMNFNYEQRVLKRKD